jgi:hypothetical protein
MTGIDDHGRVDETTRATVVGEPARSGRSAKSSQDACHAEALVWTYGQTSMLRAPPQEDKTRVYLYMPTYYVSVFIMSTYIHTPPQNWKLSLATSKLSLSISCSDLGFETSSVLFRNLITQYCSLASSCSTGSSL